MRQLIFILFAIIGVSQAQTIQYIGAPTTTVISRGNFRTDSIFYLPKRTKAPTDTAAFRYQISDSSLYVWTGSQWIKAGGSGTLSGLGITGYLPQFTGTATLDTSALYTLGNQLGIGTSSFAYTGSGRTVVELNGTAGGLYGFKRNDSAKGYLFHNGDNMELANTVAGSISFNTNSATRGSIASDGVWRLNNLSGTGDRVVVASSNGTLSAASSATGLVDTLTISTRAWRQKGLDSLAALEVSGSGTTNYIPKFTAASTIGNSQIFDNGTNVGFGTAAPEAKFTLVDGSGYRLAMRQWSGTGMEINAWNDSYQPTIPLRFTANYLTLNTGNPNTERLRIFANGRIGVNTTTDAGYQFDVNGSIRAQGADNLVTLQGTDPAMSIKNSTKEYLHQLVNANNRYRIFDNTASVERLTLTTTGDIGIGQSVPAYKLDVNGTLRSVNGANFATSSGKVGIGNTNSTGAKLEVTDASNFEIAKFNGTSTGSYITLSEAGTDRGYIEWGLSNTSNPNGNYLGLYNAENGGRIRFATRQSGGTINSSALVIDENANVGIGTASPQQILHANATTGAYLQLSRTAQGGTTSPFGGIYFGDGTTFQEAAILSGADGNVVSGNMAFYTRAAAGSLLEGFRINSTQETLVGGGSDAGDYKLQVSGAIYANNPSSVALQIGGGQAIRTTGALYLDYGTSGTGDLVFRGGSGFASVLTATNAGEILINTGTDAGDYKLQVVGNARVGTGKLDIASNTTFGLGVARSGTSEIAGQIYNSNGILYFGAESSTGGGIFSGSSAYAAVIGSGAAYPLQFAVNNTVRGGFNTNGELMINTTNDQGDYVIQANGSVYNTGQVTRGLFSLIGYNSQLSIDSTKDLAPIFIGQHQITTASAQPTIYANTTWNTTGSPTMLSFDVINTASGADANWLRISDGVQVFKITKDGGLFTGTPTGGSSKKWRLGSAATVSPTSPNRTIQVEVDGVIYYLHAKTTND